MKPLRGQKVEIVLVMENTRKGQQHRMEEILAKQEDGIFLVFDVKITVDDANRIYFWIFYEGVFPEGLKI